MANDNAIFQNGWYIGNQLNCILYGTFSIPSLST